MVQRNEPIIRGKPWVRVHNTLCIATKGGTCVFIVVDTFTRWIEIIEAIFYKNISSD